MRWQLPIYYYVKTKGSLATQGLSLTKTVKMKLSVFEYYQQFFKEVLDEEEYERSRLKVYRFLVDAAGDGAVPPLPTAQRLGSERVRACSGGLLGQGCLCDSFRNRKLLEYHLETAALKNDLSTQEALLLLALRQLERPCTGGSWQTSRGCLAAHSRSPCSAWAGKGLIETETPSDADERCPVLTAESASVLRDLEIALADWQAIRLDGFTQEECVQYHAMMERINGNIQNFLQ